jgi:bacterioferritin
VVELLNDALTVELTVTNTYFLHARMLDNWGLSRLGKVYYDLSIDEMKDADALINRILMYDGHPNVQRLNPIQVGESPEEMLRLAFDSEKAAIAQFNASAQECRTLGDYGTAAVFEEMVRDEEQHADWFESQLDAIDRVGLAQERQGLAVRGVELAEGRAQRVERRPEHLTEAIDQLSDRERRVIALYYFEGLTLAEIGDVLGVTESRVCQIHTKAVGQLRLQFVESD